MIIVFPCRFLLTSSARFFFRGAMIVPFILVKDVSLIELLVGVGIAGLIFAIIMFFYVRF